MPTSLSSAASSDYAIENNRIAKDYLVNYTNAAFIIKDGFNLPEDGLFSGFDPEKKVYDKKTWNYEEGGDLAGKPVAATPPEKTPPPLPAARRRLHQLCPRRPHSISRCSIRAASINC